MACPMGVVVPYASVISQGFGLRGGNAVIPAMREPRARPSKVSVAGEVKEVKGGEERERTGTYGGMRWQSAR